MGTFRCKKVANMAQSTLKLDTRRALKDGTFPVKISVGFGTRLYIATDVAVRREDWEVGKDKRETGKVVGRKDAKQLNQALQAQLLRVTSRALRLRQDGRLAKLSPERLHLLLTAPDMNEVPEEDTRLSFYRVADMCIATKDGRTREVYLHTLQKVRAFAGETLYLEDIDRVWLHRFQESVGGKVNSRAIHAFLHADLGPREREHRDVFLLMFYFRGINVGDLAALTEEDVVDGRVEYRRSKTGQLFSIKLEPEMLEILERWKGERHLLRCFDRYTDHHDYNRRLREALRRIKGPDGEPVEPDVSSNWARHTWATLCAELDVPDPTITLGMGHATAGHRTTAIYIKRDRSKVDEANRKVIDHLWEKE